MYVDIDNVDRDTYIHTYIDTYIHAYIDTWIDR